MRNVCNFTQTGNIAILDKFKRAKLAISNGVDIVIELPFIYSNSSANLFSYGALNILDKIGVVDIYPLVVKLDLQQFYKIYITKYQINNISLINTLRKI